MKSRLCVASFGEDVSWVGRSGLPACIYDATGSRPGLVPVPNEAREASQYLRYIVEHYGQFEDFEVFTQGNPFDHQPHLDDMLKHQPWKGSRVYPLGRLLYFDPSNAHRHTSWAIEFAEDIGIDPSGRFLWAPGAMFAASRDALMSRPLEWWKRLLAKVIIERERSPWAIERLWLRILES